MVNSVNPSNDRITLQSLYNRHEASQKPWPPSKHPTAGNFFRRPPFRLTSIPIGTSLSDLHSGGSLAGKNLSTRPHAPIFNSMLKFTHRRMATREALFGHAPPQAVLFATDESLQPLHTPCRRLKSLLFHFFSPMTVSELFCH